MSVRICARCGNTAASRALSVWKANVCDACFVVRQREVHGESLHTLRTCTSCVIDLENINFYKKSRTCIWCHRAAARAAVKDAEKTRTWRAQNRDKISAAQRRHYAAEKINTPDASYSRHIDQRYALSPERYRELMAEQEGRCAACRSEFVRKPDVDHNHHTGVVRGLLCHPCNVALGLVKDDPERLRALAHYLEIDTRNRYPRGTEKVHKL